MSNKEVDLLETRMIKQLFLEWVLLTVHSAMLDFTASKTTEGKCKSKNFLPLSYRRNTFPASYQKQRTLSYSFWRTQWCFMEPWKEQRLLCSLPSPVLQMHSSLQVLSDGGVATTVNMCLVPMKAHLMWKGLWRPQMDSLQCSALFCDEVSGVFFAFCVIFSV